MRELVIDTETTGLDVKQNHRIIEIGCIELIDRVKTGNFFHCYVNPQRDIPISSQEIHGITNEFISDKPLFKDIASEFFNFLSKDKLIIHNASFDMRFINFELKHAGYEEISFDRAVDSLILARKRFPGSKVNLDALCKRFGINLDKRDKHGALIDAELLSDVYLELIGCGSGSQGKMNLCQSPSINQVTVNTLHEMPQKEKRHFNPSPEELNAHKEFCQKIQDPIWLL